LVAGKPFFRMTDGLELYLPLFFWGARIQTRVETKILVFAFSSRPLCGEKILWLEMLAVFRETRRFSQKYLFFRKYSGNMCILLLQKNYFLRENRKNKNVSTIFAKTKFRAILAIVTKFADNENRYFRFHPNSDQLHYSLYESYTANLVLQVGIAIHMFWCCFFLSGTLWMCFCSQQTSYSQRKGCSYSIKVGML
jgi:hypothetical protein